MAVACGAVAVAMAAAAAAGVFARGDGAELATTSIRGEPYSYATTGVYAFNASRVVAEGVGWDWFTLVVAAPALLVATPWVARGSLRGRLFALGLLAYAFYQYLMYAVTWAFGPLFPLFVALYAGSLATAVWVISTIPIAGLPAAFGARFPRRSMSVVSIGTGIMLVVMWTGRIVAGLRGEDEVLYGMTTLTVQALDLGLIVPLCMWTGAALLRGRPIGHLLAPVLAVKGVAMAAAIVAMLLSAWVVEGRPEVVPLVLFSTLALAMTVVGARMYTSTADERR